MKRWKVIGLTMLLLMAMVIPVKGADQINLLYNGKRGAIEVINKNGSFYVPIRQLVEFLGVGVIYDVSGEKKTFILFDNSYKPIQRPGIVAGDAQQTKVINQALDLLKEKDAGDYSMVCKNVKAIAFENIVNENNHFAQQDGQKCELLPTLYNDPKYFVPEFVAGTLVHESYHICSSNEDGSDEANPIEEYRAYKHGALAWDLIGAPQWMIDWSNSKAQEYLKKTAK